MADEYLCTFAGVPFRMPPPALLERLERFGFPRDLFPERILPGPALQRIGFPEPLPYPPQRVNQWFYPTGASRTSIFIGVMDADQLQAVKDVVWESADTQAAATFIIKSKVPEAEDAVETEMFLLSAFPMSVEGTEIYLVTLTDERYYWHQSKNGGVINCLSGTDTWSEILDLLETQLGITLTYDAVSSDYGYPEPDSPLYSNYENPAVLLDMVAANVGCSVVRAMDGTYSLQRYSDAVEAMVASRSTTTAFGGEFVADASDDYRSMMPASIMVVFPKWVDGTGDGAGYYEPEDKRIIFKDSYGATWTKTNTLAALGSPYSTYANNGLTKVLHTTFRARFTLVGDANPNNQTAAETLATKLAKDYLDSRSVWIDESYRGIASLTPNGLSDFIFCFNSLGVHTRTMAPPMSAGYHNFQHGPVAGGISPTPCVFFPIRIDDVASVDVAVRQVLTHGTNGCLEWVNVEQCDSIADGITIDVTPVSGGADGDILTISGGLVSSSSLTSLLVAAGGISTAGTVGE